MYLTVQFYSRPLYGMSPEPQPPCQLRGNTRNGAIYKKSVDFNGGPQCIVENNTRPLKTAALEG